MQIMVDGLLTAYELHGKGKAVLLLHGWGSRARDLGILQAALSSRYQVVTPDLPGFGDSEAPKHAWGLDEYAKFLGSFLHKIGITDLYAIVGHSNGGAVAIRGLASGILTAEKLVLLASAGIRSGAEGRKRLLSSAAHVGKLLAKPLPKSAQQTLRRKLYQSVGSDMLVAEHMQASFKRVVGDDVQADARKLAVPTLLVYGEQDTSTPVVHGELLHELIDDSTLEILPGAGHFMFVDRPKETIHAVEDFLR